jgi:hypothetical protein
MEYIISLFSEQLSTYIHGFSKEQVNANLLSGKGEISEVHVKVEPINEIIETSLPFIEFSSVYISKLSFNVTSIRQIRKSPIEISIDEIHVVLVERLKFTGYSEQTWKEVAKSFVEKAKKSGSYGLIERIRDNITLDINRVYVTFQPMGRFKTRRIGPWTPPAISVVLNNVRCVTVDEYGEEGTPDDVWRHNSRKGRQENMIRSKMNSDKAPRILQPNTNMIFKKLTFDASIGIGKRLKGMSAKQSFMSSHILLVNVPIQNHLALHRRLRDNALLAVQLDISLTNVEMIIESETLPLLTHALVGLKFCFLKDRSFVDPLNDGQTDENLLLLDEDLPSYNIEDDTSEMDNNGDIKVDQKEIAEFNSLDSDEEDEDNETVIPSQSKDDKESNWPAIIMPSEIIIVEKLCVSFSIHNLSVRTKYDSNANGYLQFTMKGLVTELIWPKTESRTGGYLQVSLSHFSIFENYNNKIRTILNGGDDSTSNMYEGKQTTNEELFPTMEDRDVRSGPDLRSSFPIQSFCLKATIDLLGEVSKLYLQYFSIRHFFSFTFCQFITISIGKIFVIKQSIVCSV